MVSYVGFKAYDMGFDAHLTVCYFGEGNKKAEAGVQKILENPEWQGPTFVARHSIDLFGPDHDIPVLRVTVPGVLHTLRFYLAQFSVSQFDWNPHITLDLDDATDIHIPVAIKLDDLGVY